MSRRTAASRSPLFHSAVPPRPRRRREPSALVVWLGVAFLVLAGAGWGLGVLVPPLIGAADLSALRFLAGHRSPGLTSAMLDLSLLGSAPVLTAVALAAILVLLATRRAMAALAVAVAAIGAEALSAVVKVLADRPRPPLHHVVAVASPSWPSGHATDSLAIYGVLVVVALWRWSRRGGALLAVAVAVLVVAIGFSRPYLAVHYPSDVVAGWVLAGGWLAAVSWAAGR